MLYISIIGQFFVLASIYLHFRIHAERVVLAGTLLALWSGKEKMGGRLVALKALPESGHITFSDISKVHD